MLDLAPHCSPRPRATYPERTRISTRTSLSPDLLTAYVHIDLATRYRDLAVELIAHHDTVAIEQLMVERDAYRHQVADLAAMKATPTPPEPIAPLDLATVRAAPARTARKGPGCPACDRRRGTAQEAPTNRPATLRRARRAAGARGGDHTPDRSTLPGTGLPADIDLCCPPSCRALLCLDSPR
jgi:hypothetical protein